MNSINDEFCLQCMECDEQCKSDLCKERNNFSNECDELCCLTESINSLNINNKVNTIVLTKLLEKLIKEMNCEKYLVNDKNEYNLNISLPYWFKELDIKYQNILMKLIEPILYYRLNN